MKDLADIIVNAILLAKSSGTLTLPCNYLQSKHSTIQEDIRPIALAKPSKMREAGEALQMLETLLYHLQPGKENRAKRAVVPLVGDEIEIVAEALLLLQGNTTDEERAKRAGNLAEALGIVWTATREGE